MTFITENAVNKSLMPDNYPASCFLRRRFKDLVAYSEIPQESSIWPRPFKSIFPEALSFAWLRNAQEEPQNWLTYWGNYQGHHFSLPDPNNSCQCETVAGTVVRAACPPARSSRPRR